MATAYKQPSEPVDLSRLNETEARVLRLLAEGHTAKSIAVELGLTPAAVNERLREARRKTGTGSSRELARLLKAQENQDKIIGVAATGITAASLSSSDAEPWRPHTGVLAMIGLFLVTAAGAAALLSQAPAANNEVDPLIGAPLQRGPEPVELHAKVRSEPRDGNWAPAMESAIRDRTMQIPLIGRGSNVLRVTCGSTICEIAGTLVAPKNKAELDDQNSPNNRTVKALQVAPFPEDLAKLGLKYEGGTFTSGKGKPDRLVFLIYCSRGAGKTS